MEAYGLLNAYFNFSAKFKSKMMMVPAVVIRIISNLLSLALICE